ncbi:MAG: RNA ligase RtcB family protein [Bacteroidota bacterium]|nr:RNA ligase RtcB family protein [Pseudomonadota bacterium]MEA3495581.1 RNA ligase RtcB family protein [Bacteroidota bacterium]
MNNLSGSPHFHIVESEKSWIEGKAVEQLKKTSELPGMERVIGMPDIHPGKGAPVGAVFISKDIIYPYLLGNDVGCGIGLWQTQLKRNKLKRDRWVKKLTGLETAWGGDIPEWLSRYSIKARPYDDALGTLGGGNHFAELQLFEQIENLTLFKNLGLDKNRFMVLVHSGSRGLGESILRSHTDVYGAQGLEEESNNARVYIEKHDQAIKWAAANRALIAHRFTSCLGTQGVNILDICHNSLTSKTIEGGNYWLHRKGAVSAEEGAIVIAGTRGSLSYLVMPTSNQKLNGYSLAHGAGRKWNRHESRKRLSSRYKPQALLQTELGSRVICENKDLLYEEAPQSYKNIETVIQDLQNAGLIEVVASLRPIITYKVRSQR